MLDEFHNKFHRQELLVSSPIFPLVKYTNPKKSVEEAIGEMFKKDHISFVAEDRRKLIAHISGKIIERKGKVLNKEGYIDEWFVKKEYRGKGVGKKLYEVLLQEFKKRRCTHIGLDTYAENKEARKLYRKLGFKNYILIMKQALD